MTTQTKPQATATPRPWRVANGGCIIFRQQNPGGRKTYIADASQDPGINACIANAALIVEAVNQHEALIYALQTISDAGVKGPLAIADFYSIMEVAKDALESVRNA